MLTLVGWDHPEENAKAIADLETALAQAIWLSGAERRDPDKTYNPMTPDQLETLAPGFPWHAFLAKTGLPPVNRLDVGEPTAFTKIAAIYGATPARHLEGVVVALRVADRAAPWLSMPLWTPPASSARRRCRARPNSGPRWKRAAGVVDRGMGEAVGRVYVARAFRRRPRSASTPWWASCACAARRASTHLDRLSAETKARKPTPSFDMFTVKIAYPDKWRDYGALPISSDDLVGDLRVSQAFEWNRDVEAFERSGGSQRVVA